MFLKSITCNMYACFVGRQHLKTKKTLHFCHVSNLQRTMRCDNYLCTLSLLISNGIHQMSDVYV